jgi:CBS domain-containing protein
VTVGDVMTRDPVVLRPDDSAAVAIHKMAVGGFRHIPLVDGHRTLGVATARDLLRHIEHLLG